MSSMNFNLRDVAEYAEIHMSHMIHIITFRRGKVTKGI